VSAWHHIAITRDDVAKTVIIYLDGEIHASGTYAAAVTMQSDTIVGAAATGQLTIGRGGSRTGYYLDGQVDELTVYNRVLLGSEIYSIFHAGSGMGPYFGKCVPPPPGNGNGSGGGGPGTGGGSANVRPIADAGPHQDVAEGSLVSLNGTASSD